MERPTTTHHPARREGPESAPRVDVPKDAWRLIPDDVDHAVLGFGEVQVRVSNLRKVYWPDRGITKGDLLRYYARVAPALLPHLRDRAMVMRRYPDGIESEGFFMKRSPPGTPDWVPRCAIRHASGSTIDFPMIQDLPGLMWVVNLGCIDLNQWYARCDDVDRPDYLHFDLDPVPDAGFDRVRETALAVHEALEHLGLPSYAKTTGSKGIHVYVPIRRGPTQKEVWTFAKALARTLERGHPDLVTAEYRIDKRPMDRVLVDYNQNAWGRTLASVYSVRPKPKATVSTPVTWEELAQGAQLGDFRMDNVPERIERLGDLWAPLLDPRRRADLGALL